MLIVAAAAATPIAIAIAIAIAAAVTKRREVEALQLSDKVALCHAPKRQLA